MHSDSEFICSCLRSQSPSVYGVDWEAVLARACWEAVLPALSGCLDAPEPIAAFLDQVTVSNRERNEFILAELSGVVGLLNGAGIEPVLLKGAAYFASGVYEDIGRRYLVDVDLLVREEDLGVAAGTLLEDGFVAEDRDGCGHFRHHHPPLRRPGSVSFEIHHRMGVPQCERVLTAREVIEGSVAHVLPGGLRVRVPKAEHLMTHLILHSQLQHPYHERIWPPLRALWDLVLLDRRFGAAIPWDAVVERFRAAGYYRVLALHLMRVERAFAPELPLVLRRDWATRLLWLRREAIRWRPGLRYADPVYMFATVLGRRLALLRKLLGTRAGLRHVGSQLTARGNYARLWSDLVEGRGR